MNKDELSQLFDQQAAGYDKQWSRLSAINDCLYLFLDSIYADLPTDAHILCVGAGTGRELIHLAEKFPGWRFTAVEPSSEMVTVCRQNIEERGITERCELICGYVDSLPDEANFDGATSVLVSQFILNEEDRRDFFRSIAVRLKLGGTLVSGDLSFDRNSAEYLELLTVWFRTMSSVEIDSDGLARMRAAYENDVAVLPPAQVASIIEAAGFDAPTEFFRAGLICGWFTKLVEGQAQQ